MRTSGRPGCGPKPVHPVLVALLFVVVALQGALGQGLLAALAQAKDAMQERPVDALEPAAEPVTLGARPTTPPLQTASLSAVAAPAASSAAVLTKLRGQVREPTEAEMLQATQRWRLTEAQAKELGVSRLAGKMAVCISPYTPDIFCDEAEPPESYKGYGVSVFEAIARRTSFLKDFGSWGYRCVPWDVMEEGISNPNSTDCIAAVMVNPSPSEAYQSTRPINQIGVSILTRTRTGDQGTGLFTPFGAFSWQLWLLLFASAFIVGGVLWLYDLLDKAARAEGEDEEPDALEAEPSKCSLCSACGSAAAEKDRGGSHDKAAQLSDNSNDLSHDMDVDVEAGSGSKGASGGKSSRLGSRSASGASAGTNEPQAEGKGDDQAAGKPKRPRRRFLRMLSVKAEDEKETLDDLTVNMRSTLLHMTNAHEPPSGVSLPAHIVLWAWGLLVMIVLSLYTGTTAAIMTTKSLTQEVNGRSDLAGKKVGTWEDYVAKLQGEGISAIPFKWDVTADEEKMLDALATGRIIALVMDTNFVTYTAGQNCSFTAVGDTFLTNDVGLGLSNDMPLMLIEEINSAIIQVVDDGTVEELRNTHVSNLGGPCDVARTEVSPSSQLQVEQVLGLWVILGLAMMVGAALLGLKWFRVRAAKKLKMKEALARARRATLSRAASIKRNSRPSEHAATAPRGGRLLGLLAGGKGRAGRGPAAAPPAE